MVDDNDLGTDESRICWNSVDRSDRVYWVIYARAVGTCAMWHTQTHIHACASCLAYHFDREFFKEILVLVWKSDDGHMIPIFLSVAIVVGLYFKR